MGALLAGLVLYAIGVILCLRVANVVGRQVGESAALSVTGILCQRVVCVDHSEFLTVGLAISAIIYHWDAGCLAHVRRSKHRVIEVSIELRL